MNERLVPESTQPHPTGAADPVATQAEPWALAQQLYDYRFSVAMGVSPRSQAFKAGFMDGVLRMLYGKPIAFRYTMGTAEHDAHMYGVDEGRAIGKETAEASPLPAQFSAGQLVELALSGQRGRVKSSFSYGNRRIYVVDFGEDIGIPATSYAEEASLIALEDPAP